MTDKAIQMQLAQDKIDHALHDGDEPLMLFDGAEFQEAIKILEAATSLSIDEEHALVIIMAQVLGDEENSGKDYRFSGSDFFDCLSDDMEAGFVETDDVRKATRILTQVGRNLYQAITETLLGLAKRVPITLTPKLYDLELVGMIGSAVMVKVYNSAIKETPIATPPTVEPGTPAYESRFADGNGGY